jgi:uncharacterized membrane protein
MIIPILLIIAGIIGVAVSSYVFFINLTHREAVCLIGDKKCNAVISSKYGKTFGVDNSIGGLGYYTFIIALGIAELANFSLLTLPWVQVGKIILSSLAALFSLYLLYVMTFKLKTYCEWCLVSTAASISIFILILL